MSRKCKPNLFYNIFRSEIIFGQVKYYGHTISIIDALETDLNVMRLTLLGFWLYAIINSLLFKKIRKRLRCLHTKKKNGKFSNFLEHSFNYFQIRIMFIKVLIINCYYYQLNT